MRSLPHIILALALLTVPTRAVSLEISRQAIQMGTYAKATVRAPDRETGLRLAGEALAAIDQAENLLSTWRSESEVSRINRSPVDVPVELSHDLLLILSEARAIATRTSFAFDPFIGALSELWEIHGSGAIPSATGREQAKRAIRSGGFSLDTDAGTIARLHPAARLDTGGFGKGAGLDRAGQRLRERGVESALLDLGGQILVLGEARPVELSDPVTRESAFATAIIGEASIATSGNSERSVEVGDKTIGHILDSISGQPVAESGSVSVIAPTGLVADSLATALFVLGRDEGLRFAAARDLPVLYSQKKANGNVTAWATEPFVQHLVHLDPSVELTVIPCR